MRPEGNSPRIALVTGASKGLGFALARKLAEANYIVVLNARNRDDLEAARRQIANAVTLAADVSAPNFGAALDKAMQKHKLARLDLVVHAAAINHMGTIRETKLSNAEATLRVNALSVISLAQATRSYLEKGISPRFTLVSSLMKYFAMPGRSTYAVSKAAAEQFAVAWGHELSAEGSPIRVQIFRPAGIETGFHGNTHTDGLSPRSDVSRMSADRAADYLFRLVQSTAAEAAPGAMNKVVAFFARHFRGITAALLQRRYRRNLRRAVNS